MQFTQERAIQVFNETKTQTRRPVHDRDVAIITHLPDTDQGFHGCDSVYSANGAALRYLVGHTYAVQPGRGKPALWWHTLNGKCEALPNPVPMLLSYKHQFGNEWETRLNDAGYYQARIKLLEIWREDVRNISLEDAVAEGFKDQAGFWEAWIMMYDRVLRRELVRHGSITGLPDRPKVLYMAWALRFELVK